MNPVPRHSHWLYAKSRFLTPIFRCPVVAGKSLKDAVHATEEPEETAKLYLILKAAKTRFLTAEHVAALKERYPS